MYRNTFLYILTFIYFFCQSCQKPSVSSYQKGLKKQQQGLYNDAIEYYKNSLNKGGDKRRLNVAIADCYRQTNRIIESVPYYERAIKSGSKDDKAVYYLAQGLKAHCDYEGAREYFLKYAKSGSNKSMAKQAAAEAAFINTINDLLQKETYYLIKNAGEYINTEGPEYAPVYKDGELIYTASNNQFSYDAIGSGFTDIYRFKYDGNEPNSGFKKTIEGKINKNRTHEACAAIAPDGTYIIFAKSNDGKKKGAVDCDLYISEIRDGDWLEPKLLALSDARSWESSPALSLDGKTLYFASNRRGGFGGIDIYTATFIDSTGEWGNVKNMGSNINTSGNEMFPHVRYDGTFFFSSDGHPGMGALDIFATTRDSAGTYMPINLGPPVNSCADDFGIYYKDKNNGYFASNRPGGKGDDDIYEFSIGNTPYRVFLPPQEKIISYLRVKTTTIDEEKPGYEVVLDSASVVLKFDSVAVAEGVTDSSGVVTFKIDTLHKYSILGEKYSYFPGITNFDSDEVTYKSKKINKDSTIRVYETKVHLQKITIGHEIVLEHIYYDYKSAEIRKDAEDDLLLVVDFLKKNPGITIELGSHTDARGSDTYNLKLSESRANSAVSFIISNGIDPSRIKAVGYGETKHIIPNAVSEEDHQKNRRTEFKVIEIN
ncbi:MAG: OmpA family protein [Cytophagales bacterium]|nr:OmpA family protein [Cytophagales bacterium]